MPLSACLGCGQRTAHALGHGCAHRTFVHASPCRRSRPCLRRPTSSHKGQHRAEYPQVWTCTAFAETLTSRVLRARSTKCLLAPLSTGAPVELVRVSHDYYALRKSTGGAPFAVPHGALRAGAASTERPQGAQRSRARRASLHKERAMAVSLCGHCFTYAECLRCPVCMRCGDTLPASHRDSTEGNARRRATSHFDQHAGCS